MQSLHPFHGSIQEYLQELVDPNHNRPDHCPLCHGLNPLRAHGFYRRTLVDVNYDGSIPVRRYLCLLCKRTISLLPEFALPYLRFSIQVIGLFLVSRLLYRRTLGKAADAASQPNMPYQRGQFWVRRFQQQAETLCAALISLTAVIPASDLSDPGVTDARDGRLDPSASFPLRRTTYPLAGLAAFSRSTRLSLQPNAGPIQFLRKNTQRLSWRQAASGLWWPKLKVGHHGCAGRKNRFVPLCAHRSSGFGGAAARRTHATGGGDRRAQVRGPLLRAYFAFG